MHGILLWSLIFICSLGYLGIGQSFFVASYSRALQQYMLSMTDFVTGNEFTLTENKLLEKHSDLKREAVNAYLSSVVGSQYTEDKIHQQSYRRKLEQSIESVFGNVLMQFISDCKPIRATRSSTNQEHVQPDNVPDYSNYYDWSNKGFKEATKCKNKTAVVTAVCNPRFRKRGEMKVSKVRVSDDFNDFQYYHRQESLLGEMIDAADEIFVSTIIQPALKAVFSVVKFAWGGIKSVFHSVSL